MYAENNLRELSDTKTFAATAPSTLTEPQKEKQVVLSEINFTALAARRFTLAVITHLIHRDIDRRQITCTSMMTYCTWHLPRCNTLWQQCLQTALLLWRCRHREKRHFSVGKNSLQAASWQQLFKKDRLGLLLLCCNLHPGDNVCTMTDPTYTLLCVTCGQTGAFRCLTGENGDLQVWFEAAVVKFLCFMR